MTQTDGKIYHDFGLEKLCQNDYTTQGNLQIHCNPYRFTNGIFKRSRTKNFKIYMEKQRLYSQTILRKKNMVGGIRFLELRLY